MQKAARLRPPKVVENRYVLRLRSIMRQVHEEVLKSALRQDSYTKNKPHFQAVGVRVQLAVRKAVGPAFDDMAKGVMRANRLALQGINYNDMRIGAQVAAIREENIHLIVNATEEYLQQIEDVLEDPENLGLRHEDLAKQLARRGEVSESRAELIARDQTLKTNAKVNELRQTNAGIEKYIWSSSHDERVREEHRELDGKTFRWDDPDQGDEGDPPGVPILCRCCAIPVMPGDEPAEAD